VSSVHSKHCCSLSSAVVGGIGCLLSTAEHCCSLSSAVVGGIGCGGIGCILSTAKHCCRECTLRPLQSVTSILQLSLSSDHIVHYPMCGYTHCPLSHARVYTLSTIPCAGIHIVHYPMCGYTHCPLSHVKLEGPL
jgi:hypothetical protein